MSIGGRPAIPVAIQREFWAAVRSGMVVAEAAASVGVSITVAWRWFRHVGGVMPESFPADKSADGLAPLFDRNGKARASDVWKFIPQGICLMRQS